MKRPAELVSDFPASTDTRSTAPDSIGSDLAAYDEIAALDSFRLVADTIPHIVWTANSDGDIDYCNRYWEDLTGIRAGGGQGWQGAVHPDDLDMFNGRWAAAVADGNDFEIEIRIRRASDGIYRWHLARAVPQRNRPGRIVRWVGTGTDIDAQRRRIEELTNSNQRLDAILHSATNISIIAADTNGTITDFNAGAEKLLGYKADEVVGKHNPSLFHLESEVADRGRELSLRAGHSVEGFEVFVHNARRDAREERECTYVRKDGGHVTVSLVVSTLTGADGSVCGFMGIAMDITARKAAEASARAAERHFRLIVDSVEDYALMMLDPTGHILSWNVGAERIKGYAADEVIGRHFSLFDTPEGRVRHHADDELRIAAEKGRYKEEGWRVRKDGTRYWAAIVLSAIYDDTGGVKGFAKVVHDITERKRTEELFQLAVEAAPNAMIMAGADGRITLVNRQTEKLFGYPREELLGKAVETLLPERFRGGHSALVGTFFAEPSMRPMGAGRELFGLHRNGNEVPVEIGLNPVDTLHGKFVLASVVDVAERRSAERKLRNQASMIELASDAILVRGDDDRITSWNQGAQKLYGWSKQEAIGQVSHELLKTILPQPLEEIQAQMSAQGRWNGELLHTRRDGSPLTVASTWTWQQDDKTGSVSVLEINYDLTERKRTEDRLLALSQRLSLATSALRVGIWDWDLRNNTIQWDERMREIYGVGADQPITYQLWASAVLPEDLVAAEAAAQREMVSNSQDPFEFRFLHPDGRIRQVQATFHTLVDAAGVAVRAVGVNLDVTERRQAEAVLQEQAILLDAASDAILVCDGEGRITYWNQGAHELYGWSAGEALGQVASRMLKTVYPVSRQEIVQSLESDGHWSGELTSATKEGGAVAVTTTWTVRRDARDRMVSVLCIDHDITERKRAEAALKEARRLLELRLLDLDRTNRELAAKNEEVEAFVYIVSHDLRGPLVNLQGFCAELEVSCRELREHAAAVPSGADAGKRFQSILTEDIPDSLRFIHTSTTKFSRLLNALLEVSRTGRQVYKSEEVDLHALARATLDTLRLTIEAASAQVSLQPLPTVSGDATALGQVFANLIGNAVKYLDPGRPGRVEIGGELRAADVHCWVRDNGVGLPASAADRLFQVFQRFHPKLAEGDGIGLALVRRIVERHGGRVWAEGEEGVGTAFHFTLPDHAHPPEIGSEAREL